MSTESSLKAKKKNGTIQVRVVDEGSNRPVSDARVALFKLEGCEDCDEFDPTAWQVTDAPPIKTTRTGGDGSACFFPVQPGNYVVAYRNYPETPAQCVKVRSGCVEHVCFDIGLNVGLRAVYENEACEEVPCKRLKSGDRVYLVLSVNGSDKLRDRVKVTWSRGAVADAKDIFRSKTPRLTAGLPSFEATVAFDSLDESALGRADVDQSKLKLEREVEVEEPDVQTITGNIATTLQRTATEFTDDVALWLAIRNTTEALSFNSYLRFMGDLFCGEAAEGKDGRIAGAKDRYTALSARRLLPFTDSDAYRVLKAATEAFVMVNCGVQAEPAPFDDLQDPKYLRRRDLPVPANAEDGFNNDYLVSILGGDESKRTLPYLAVIRAKLPDVAIKLAPFEDTALANNCFGFLQDKLANPCLLELIWSYWHEEGMLAQTINAITRRFQNVRGLAVHDPLANLEIDPLRPLSNLLWGYLQDEQHRLSVVRRNYEYDHHYGLRLEGKAVADLRAADTRSKFLEAFHNLLRLSAVFFKQDDDTTVKADAFPVLNALKEVHLILSQGAHNQFGDLPSTARIEMLMQAFLLARPEFREFLPTRIMVAYPEPWMDRVDAMKKVQGWSDTSVLHFRNLGVFGEQILLSVRYGHWSDVHDPVQALNWARFWRPQIQGYSHAYRAATGVDLSMDTVDATLPSLLLKKRLAMQQRSA